MEFEKLKIKPEGNWFKRTISSKHTKKTVIVVILGAIGGFVFYYLTEGKQLSEMQSAEIVKSIMAGALFGLFITNSPCARGRC